jgi:hypothetical protein
MIQGREGLGLSCESCQPFSVAREEIGQDLDGDVAVQPGISGSIDLAHAAGTECGDDLIRADAGAGSEPHANEVKYMCGRPAVNDPDER